MTPIPKGSQEGPAPRPEIEFLFDYQNGHDHDGVRSVSVMSGNIPREIHGLEVTKVAPDAVQISSGSIVGEDGTLLEVVAPITVTIGPTGPGGVDSDGVVRPVGAPLWHHLWLIKNPTTGDVAGVWSDLITGYFPNLSRPEFDGYTHWGYVGPWRDKPGPDLEDALIRGGGNKRGYFPTSPTLVTSNGPGAGNINLSALPSSLPTQMIYDRVEVDLTSDGPGSLLFDWSAAGPRPIGGQVTASPLAPGRGTCMAPDPGILVPFAGYYVLYSNPGPGIQNVWFNNFFFPIPTGGSR